MADVLEPERDVTLDRRIYGLQLGVLKDESDLRGEHPRGRGDDVASQHLARPPTVPPWKCGTSPLKTRRSDDLPEPDRPVDQREPLINAQIDDVEGVDARRRIPVR